MDKSFEIMVEPVSALLENEPKKRGRKKLTDEQKAENKAKRDALKPVKEKKKCGRKPLSDEEREQRKEANKFKNLPVEVREKRKELVRNYFKIPENREKHRIAVRIYNAEKADYLRAKRPTYFKTYIEKKAKTLMGDGMKTDELNKSY